MICDFAETYHIYNIYQMPVEYIATLAIGLREDSRIKMKASGLRVDIKSLLLAHIVDNTAIRVWQNSKDGEKGRNMPKSMLMTLTEEIDWSKKAKAFNTGADFDKEWEKLKNG